jgi:hypothetical protein
MDARDNEASALKGHLADRRGQGVQYFKHGTVRVPKLVRIAQPATYHEESIGFLGSGGVPGNAVAG